MSHLQGLSKRIVQRAMDRKRRLKPATTCLTAPGLSFGTANAIQRGMVTKRRIYEFDDFRIDTGQFLLARAGRTQPITPTVFRILLMLLQHAGEVVTKEELMK